MNVIGRIRLALNQSSWDNYISRFLSGKSVPEMDGPIDEEIALKYSAVFGCCRVLAETFACVPIGEYKRLENGDREKTDGTGLYDVFHNDPNPEMSAFSFRESAMFQLNLGGNFVCSRTVNRVGEIIELNPYNWTGLSILRDPDSKKIIYKIKTNAEPIIKQRGEVFHVPGPSLNGIVGLSPLEYVASAVRLGVAYETFGQKFYKNGASPSGIFKHPGVLKQEAYNRLKEDLEKNYIGMQNTGKPILAEDGLDFVSLTMKPADAQLLECKKFQIEDVCRFYRVPLHLVQNLDKATNNNIEQQSLEFVMYTMLPWFKRWEDCINTQLLTAKQRKAGYYFEHNLAGLLRGDQKSMAEGFAIGRQWGWLSVNDIRRLLNQNSIPGGDVYLQPLNMVDSGKQPDKSAIKNEILEEVMALIEKRGE
jgi:HK97 family phage portal protein